MKKSIFYDDHIKSLLDVLELYHAMQYLPEKVDEKAVEFAKYLSDYMYGDFYVQFKEYEIEDIEHQEIVTYSKSKILKEAESSRFRFARYAFNLKNLYVLINSEILLEIVHSGIPVSTEISFALYPL